MGYSGRRSKRFSKKKLAWGGIDDDDYLERTRNVSPIIHEGAELPEGSSKKAPRHSVADSFESRKSAGSIVQFLPPKDIWTLTVVLQASGEVGDSKHWALWGGARIKINARYV